MNVQGCEDEGSANSRDDGVIGADLFWKRDGDAGSSSRPEARGASHKQGTAPFERDVGIVAGGSRGGRRGGRGKRQEACIGSSK